MNTQNLINEVAALPIEERALMVEALLQSLNQPESTIDEKWVILAQKRLDEIRENKVKTVSGVEVFNKIWKKFDE